MKNVISRVLFQFTKKLMLNILFENLLLWNFSRNKHNLKSYRGAMYFEYMLATMKCQVSVCWSRRKTSPVVLHPTDVFIPFIYYDLCLPLALVASNAPSKQSFSRLLTLSVWPRYPSCILRRMVISYLEVPDIFNTFRLALLAIQGTLNNLLNNRTSTVSFFFIVRLNSSTLTSVEQPRKGGAFLVSSILIAYLTQVCH